MISRQLRRRFGDIDGSLGEQVRNLSTEQLENLGEALLDFSEVGDLVAWLEQQFLLINTVYHLLKVIMFRENTVT